jgi:peptide/nickel transport system permease protein
MLTPKALPYSARSGADRSVAPGARWVLLRSLLRDRLSLLAALFLITATVCAVSANALVDVGILRDPQKQQVLDRNKAPGWSDDDGMRLLGTDQLGRDLLSRLIYGARVSLMVGAITIAVSGGIGIVAGLIAGYYGGRIDDVIMRLVDIQMGFPTLLLALTVLYATGPGVKNLILVLALTRWMVIARVTRAMTLTLREAAFIEAARSLGAGDRRIVFRHVLPSLTSTILTLCTLEFARVMLAEAGLSFLGMGIQPPDTSWGLMLAQGRQYMTTAWWLVTFPGIAIALTALSANLLVLWIRVVTDPVQRGRIGKADRKSRQAGRIPVI